MGFLGKLADQISSQFSLGENTNNTLDAMVDGQNVKYGSLGDFAKNIDQSAERRYVEEGYLRKDPYNTVPKQFEVLFQEPSATILVKKRMFSSLAQNYRPDFMDKDEAMYFKATKILFANKCRQIAALEKLSKIQKASTILGQLDNAIMPLIFTLTDTFNYGFGEGTNFWGALGSNNPFKQDMSKFTQTIATLRRLYSFNYANQYTSWIADTSNMLQSQFGEGTGVMEFTNVTGFSTNVGIELGSSNGTFTIMDPYESMLITEYDIERAIADATNAFYNKKIFQLQQQNAEQLISDLQKKLNQYRNDRKASPITFKINPDTLLGKRVVAIIDRIGLTIPFTYDSTSAAAIFSGGAFGGGVTVPESYLQGGAAAGFDGLSTKKNKTFGGDSTVKKAFPESELSIFQRLVSTIFSKLSLMANSINAFQTSNEKTNYARRKLRFNFLGKLLIQPMDVVHMYVTSKSRYDNKLLSGLNNMFTGLGFLQNFNNSVTELTSSIENLFNPSASINMQVEKCATVGPNFPNFLWAMVREQFIMEKEGVHVFAGIVDTAADNWSDGKYQVTVNCKDQSAYFEMGKVNFNPGVDVFNGAIYDPLTPFKSNFDSITSNVKENSPVLLEENQWLLSKDGHSALVKHKLGPTVGATVTEQNIIQDQKISPTTGMLTKTFYAPDGLVYKWKEGIGVLVQFGEASQLNGPDVIGAAKTTEDPFAGQDVMNVLSLLITGYPYNFATYWKTTVATTGAGRDPVTQQDMAHNYMGSLRAALTKNNVLWGNFIPFKNLMVDDQTYAQKLRGQFDMIKQNEDINSKLKELEDIENSLTVFGVAETSNDFSINFNDPNFSKLQDRKSQLKKDIEAQIEQAEKMNQTYYAAYGDDESFNDNDFMQKSGKDKDNVANPNVRRLLRRQINSLTRRMSYNVRANDDKNFFVVDDYYDKDYDIAAFNQKLAGGISLYNNDFTTVKQDIEKTAGLLNLEIFFDTQGHIRVRPPQYNRMPSSVFYKMMYLKKSLGVQIFPQFLQDLFKDNIQTMIQRIEILEDQIRLDCAALGYNDDNSAQLFIAQNKASSLGDGETFGFVSDEDSGDVGNVAILMKLANADSVEDFTWQQLVTFGKIQLQAESTKQTFNTTYRAKAILSAITKEKLAGQGYGLYDLTSVNDNPRVTSLISRIQTKSGQRISKDYFIKVSDGAISGGLNSETIDIFKITEDLATKWIPERQKAIKSLYSAIKNAASFKFLDDKPDTANLLLMPGMYGHKEIPEVFEHMIEDESYDDLGPGSGSRYVIKRAQIKSMNFSEKHPIYTEVEVRGVMNPYAPDALPTELKTFPQGGNALVTATAIDYDMWRNYGICKPNAVDVPFFENPNTQCAPYAAMLLSRARKEVLQGSVTISGNEYMQPGEVVFIEDRGLLFYISSVNHTFGFNGDFTTKLELRYGHAPGEYIPVPLDVIGKMIYNNRDTASLIVQRQASANNDSNMGVIQKEENNPMVVSSDKDLQSRYSNDNMATINSILLAAQQYINANNTPGNNVNARIELRIYYDDNNPTDTDLKQFANSAREILIGKIDTASTKDPKNTSVATTPYLDEKNVSTIIEVNLSDVEDSRSPSQRALSAARMRLNSTSMSSGGASTPDNNDQSTSGVTTGDQDPNKSNGSAEAKKQKDKLRAAIFRYIVDCWLVITDVESEVNSTGS